MFPRRIPVLLLLLAFCLAVPAQRDSSNPTTQLKIQIFYDEDGHPAGKMLNVQLQNAAENYLNQAFTDDLGTVEFRVASGDFRVTITGSEIQSYTSGTFTIFRETVHNEQFQVKRKHKADEQAPKGAGQTVSASDLSVPDGAKREYNRGMDSLNDGKMDDAHRHFDNAIRSYPTYARAYNGLGVVYMRTGKKDDGRKAFEAAVKNDDHLALALVNLARLDISEGNYPRAEGYLDRALSAEPENLDALALATLAEFMVGRMDSVIDNAHRVHAQAHGQYAIVHLLAARALHKKNLDNQSIAEYKLFLEESPASPNAARARTELEALQKKTP